MKKISNGMVFDTETATELVRLKTKNVGDGGVYRTEKGNYFCTYEPSKKHKLEGEVDNITYLEDGVSGVDEIIEEWQSEFGEESVTINWEMFEIG
jgi:hypothetical protein